MAATYVQPTLMDFEEVFGTIAHKRTGEPAFELTRPADSEAYYTCRLRENEAGSLVVRVYTSVAARQGAARDCGEDAIRCALVWLDAEGWARPLGKGTRVNRCGGQGATARSVVERALERAREVARCRGALPACPVCGRPMAVRVAAKTGKAFYGCIAWKPQGEGCNGVRWDAPESDPAVQEAKDRWAKKKG
jgi:hypothetical protein